MDNFSFFISDNNKLILDEQTELAFDADDNRAEFLDNVSFKRQPREPVLHLIDGKTLVATIALEPITYRSSGRRGFSADLDTDQHRIAVRLCELSHIVFGVQVTVTELSPLKDIQEVLARAGIETDSAV